MRPGKIKEKREREKLELFGIWSMVWNNFQSSPPPLKKKERGKQEEEWGGHGCLVRSVKQWWTASDGKSIKKNPQNSKKIKSGVCRNGLETFVDPTVVDGHIYLLFIRKKEKKEKRTNRACMQKQQRHERSRSIVSFPYWAAFPHFHSNGGSRVLIRMNRYIFSDEN